VVAILFRVSTLYASGAGYRLSEMCQSKRTGIFGNDLSGIGTLASHLDAIDLNGNVQN
jgi:hypothetical protein